MATNFAGDIKAIMELLKRGVISKEKAAEAVAAWMAPPQMMVVPKDAMLKDHLNDALTYGMALHRETSGIPDLLAGAQQQGKNWTLYDKLKMRLNLQPGETFGFDFLHIFNSGRKIFVFVVHGDEAAYIEDDDPVMFPTDRFLARYLLVHDNMVKSVALGQSIFNLPPDRSR